MKRHIFFLAFALMLSLTCTTRSFAADAVTDNKIAATERLQQIKSRLEEIKHMDKTNLTREERRELKHEVKGMRKEAKAMGGGVYLSVGAILIIILVLILIL
ncbi:MAG TPA: hypothetical protein VHB48_00470 [Chitinophagaceae bacterium]|jgi:hypothetical protein|nr:hypothetical protein [Chitinophagaceae bacterium]